MAITQREWSRSNPGALGPSGWPTNTFQPISVVYSSFTNPGPWVLQRYELDVVFSVYVEGGAGYAMRWWERSNVRVGAKHSPDATDPGMVRNDEAPAVLGIRMMHPTFVGDLTGTGPYAVTWRMHSTFENRTQRGAQGNTLSAVWAYLWADDEVFALTHGDPPIAITQNSEAAALWGK